MSTRIPGFGSVSPDESDEPKEEPGTFGEVIQQEQQKKDDPNRDSWSMSVGNVTPSFDIQRDPVGENSGQSSSSSSQSSSSQDEPRNDYSDEINELRSELKRRDEAIQSLSQEMQTLGSFVQQQQQGMMSMFGGLGGLGSSGSGGQQEDKKGGGGIPSMGVLAAIGGAIALIFALAGGAN